MEVGSVYVWECLSEKCGMLRIKDLGLNKQG